MVTEIGTCFWCEEPVLETDEYRTIPHMDETVTQEPYHDVCFVRMIIGGLNHLAGRCSCCGGTDPPDPPGLTKREAAFAAVRYFRDNHQPVAPR